MPRQRFWRVTVELKNAYEEGVVVLVPANSSLDPFAARNADEAKQKALYLLTYGGNLDTGDFVWQPRSAELVALKEAPL